MPGILLLEAVEIINSAPADRYLDILNHVTRASGSEEVYSAEELVELEQALGLSVTGVQLLVHGIEHIFRKSSRVIVKPAALQRDLTDVLSMDANKAEAFVKAWTETAKREFGDLDERKKLDDVVWQLNLETNSSRVGLDDTIVPKGRLQLSLSDFSGGNAENVTLEMNEGELLQLYDTLEGIQNKLDAIQISMK